MMSGVKKKKNSTAFYIDLSVLFQEKYLYIKLISKTMRFFNLNK